MIEGGWAFVIAAYVVTIALLGALTLAVAMSARRWAKRARELEPRA